MSGVLVVDKHTLRPLRATITNTEPISPAPTVKIAKLLQEYEFLVEPATTPWCWPRCRLPLKARR